jgi:hypothetical protein
MVGFSQDVLCIDGMVAVVFLCDFRVLFKHCQEHTFCLSYVMRSWQFGCYMPLMVYALCVGHVSINSLTVLLVLKDNFKHIFLNSSRIQEYKF